MTSRHRAITVCHLGLMPYDEAHRLQRQLQAQRRDGGGVDSLLLVEHPPVFTLGQSHPEPNLRAEPALLAARGIQIVQTERGGDITYHGPGQLVVYGIVDLRAWRCSVLDYVTGLEEACIATLADWGVRAAHSGRGRGVWVEDRKIASVGLNVRRWVTMHGIALNVDPDMSHFDLINPCGMPDVEMTSLRREAGVTATVDEVAGAFVSHFGDIFDCAVVLDEADAGRASSRR